MFSTSGIDEDLVLVEGGTFTLGEDHPDWDRILPSWAKNNDKRQEKVESFYISRYPVTFSQYDFYCNDVGIEKPKDEGFGRNRHPVINIKWTDAIKYCNWLSRRAGLNEAFSEDGRLIVYDENGKKTLYDCGKKGFDKEVSQLVKNVEGYRLPTDAEWEYAAKGGKLWKKYKYIGGDNPDEVGWYKDNTRYSTKEIGLKQPNELQIHDMAGNVYEFCLDGKNNLRTCRGGGWSSQKESLRVSFKNGCRMDEAHSYLGFRVVRTHKEKK